MILKEKLLGGLIALLILLSLTFLYLTRAFNELSLAVIIMSMGGTFLGFKEIKVIRNINLLDGDSVNEGEKNIYNTSLVTTLTLSMLILILVLLLVSITNPLELSISQNVNIHNSTPVVETILIDLNDSTLEELMSLPSIGEVTAKKIINSRPFSNISELLNLMGETKYNNVKGLVTIDKVGDS